MIGARRDPTSVQHFGRPTRCEARSSGDSIIAKASSMRVIRTRTAGALKSNRLISGVPFGAWGSIGTRALSSVRGWNLRRSSGGQQRADGHRADRHHWRPLLSSGPLGSTALARDDRAFALLSAVGACGRCMMGCEGAGGHICESGSRPRDLLGFAGTHAATIAQTGRSPPDQRSTRRSVTPPWQAAHPGPARRNAVPASQIRSITTADFRATATLARLAPTRRSRSRPQLRRAWEADPAARVAAQRALVAAGLRHIGPA